MNQKQKNDLLVEWSIYTPQQQAEIISEYHDKFGKIHEESHWLEFLKEKLEIEDYWKKTGLL